MKAVFVTGTGTEVGKTLVSLGLCLSMKADYWKPIQTGMDKDYLFIKKFLPAKRVHPCTYDFKKPLSPNQAAQKEKISLDKINPPQRSRLIIEGAGGVLVPLNTKDLMIDLIAQLGFPTIVTAKSGLGTINHSLLTLEALKKRGIKTLGVILSGDFHKENKKDIERYGKTPVILELPFLKTIDSKQVLKAFEKIRLSYFEARSEF